MVLSASATMCDLPAFRRPWKPGRRRRPIRGRTRPARAGMWMPGGCRKWWCRSCQQQHGPSTARPDGAMTLALIMRLMPAADGRQQAADGGQVRQTSSATVTVTTRLAVDRVDGERHQRHDHQQEHHGRPDQQNGQRQFVWASSGAWRLPPWRSCRSRKLSPGSAAIRTKIQSGRARCPDGREVAALLTDDGHLDSPVSAGSSRGLTRR